MAVTDDDEDFFDVAINVNNNNNNYKPDSLTPRTSNTDSIPYHFTISIIDANTDKTKLNFTVKTTTNLPSYNLTQNSTNTPRSINVIRQHEDFVWLYQSLSDNTQYAGYLIPPTPPKPDFSSSRDKVDRLNDVHHQFVKNTKSLQPDNNPTINKLRAELEAEYLATFKKYVSSHEHFLSRLANHMLYRNDENLQLFLEYQGDLSNHERTSDKHPSHTPFMSIFSKAVQFGDEYIFKKMSPKSVYPNSQTDEDNQYSKFLYLNDKYKSFNTMSSTANKIVYKQKKVANCSDWMNELMVQVYNDQKKIENSYKSSGITNVQSSSGSPQSFPSMLQSLAILHKSMLIQSRTEARLANDLDLKLGVSFNYTSNDLKSAQTLLYRRKRTKDYLARITNEISSKSSYLNSTSSYDIEVLKNKQKQLEEDLQKFNEIGAQELDKQEKEQQVHIPNSIRQHARLQYQRHRQAADELKSLLDKL